ncbi:hypothetical protein GLOTRDRAFT_115194 [Gloeophyllum trabeum ATCC 11539]|uniref:Uncharacterized protein n=1 Tax=Gloeophyllum trabeum (strain ATCC 11539 / FP-39264 / Madison 617) TaxID=670483 RepID=S7RRA0_GLOTA|nr:uncharacterized protein GLOTRDRAFT_115194 [Gloeophyllum trabeum ATCC 11539]EPQ57155.1 hypothetical protein GLOTRDRAFT_115194 [Gloeophyllum trabeum ATCC 11539]
MAHRRTDSSRKMHILMGPKTPVLSDAGHIVGPPALPTPPLSPGFAPAMLAPEHRDRPAALLPYATPSHSSSSSSISIQLSVSSSSSSPSAAANPLRLLDALAPYTRKRPKHWHRTTLVALALLVLLSFYVFLVAQPNLGVRLRPSAPPVAATLPLSPPSRRPKYGAVHHRPTRPQLTLDPAQELAAVTSFIVALPQNVIPPSVDPSKPIDPELVLDFDTRGEGARAELDEVIRDVWTRFPVILFSKYHSAASREVKAILDGMNLKPAPAIIDVDQRPDADTLAPLLYRLTTPYLDTLAPFPDAPEAPALPVLLLSGHPLSLTQIRELNARGELRAMVGRSGAVVGGGKRKKGGRR